MRKNIEINKKKNEIHFQYKIKHFTSNEIYVSISSHLESPHKIHDYTTPFNPIPLRDKDVRDS